MTMRTKGRATRLHKIFSREALERYKAVGSQSEQPIFIVGMIRSGTTLTEQILSPTSGYRKRGRNPVLVRQNSRTFLSPIGSFAAPEVENSRSRVSTPIYTGMDRKRKE